ncbi:hypothetical protein P5E99_15595 [Clostridium perfringens]|uniref:hypothetical protein n=1 Tax=Clostridium perfringens TaxID=1502 RepID=UPI001106C803|nr:hypothetical protein [Clostridium perfringens]EGT4144720.1 hypothetical protein [Clostridium perfringens]MDK0610361.1 hypothetical protein [Clostridium perfringens]MDK0675353.1 hypothetical protein [Clostridium perfringens]MDM0758069.1 hypothetical protein [Clostridium perfringens]MDM0760967.1 hypothetical protein [Clostridium perfringens]
MCPRCKNEKLQGTENYCPICGLKLKEKAVQEINTPEQAIIYIDLDEKLVKKIIREIIEEKQNILFPKVF